jgi:hypothetical protein
MEKNTPIAGCSIGFSIGKISEKEKSTPDIAIQF